MKAIKGKGSRRIEAVTVGYSTIFIPVGFDPRRNLGSFVYGQMPIGVPITNILLSLMSWSRLTEERHQRLIKIGPPELARQRLPRGGT